MASFMRHILGRCIAKAWPGTSRQATPMGTPEPPLADTKDAWRHRWQEIIPQVLQGNLAAAELELYAWHRQSDCPSEASLLLACLLARRGQRESARQILWTIGQKPGDQEARSQQVRISLLIQDGYHDAAKRQAWHYHHHQGHHHDTALWLQAMEVPGQPVTQELPQSVVDSLAMQLLDHWRLLATLVAAQRISPDPQQIRLLRAAGLRCHRDMNEQRAGYHLCLAMADLAMLVHDGDDARRWAYRGLKLEPYSAELALILGQLEDDPSFGPSAADVLAQAVEAHPKYPDLKAALIRREMALGKTQEARRRLQQWIEQEPSHPVAMRLVREIAA